MCAARFSNLELIHQYVYEVVDFSSQYGSENGTSYSAANLVGPCQVYPNYCDSSATCSFRTFGHWWHWCPSALKSIASPPPSRGYTSDDYVDLYFDVPVIPARIQIFETYNPGAIVRILACYRTQHSDVPVDPLRLKWVTLWQAPAAVYSTASAALQLTNNQSERSSGAMVVLSQTSWPRRTPGVRPRRAGCMDSEFYESSEFEQRARVFQPPIRNPPALFTDLIRLEFDGSRCPYYTEIDAVRLTGWAEVSRRARYNQIEGVIPTLPTTDERKDSTSDQSLSFFSDLLRPQTPHLDANDGNQVTSQYESLEVSVSDFSSTPPSPSPEPLAHPSVYPTHENVSDSSGLCRLPSFGLDLLLPRAGHHVSMAPGAICPSSLFGLIHLNETALWRHGPVTRLPYEVLLHIFSFLDLQSICRASRVSRQFRCLADDALAQLVSLNLQPYWPNLSNAPLLSLGRRLGRVNLTARAAAVATTGNSVIPYTLLRRLVLERSGPRQRLRPGILAARVRSLSTSSSLTRDASPTTADIRGPAVSTQHVDNQDPSADLLEAYNIAFPHCRLKRLDMSWCGNYSQISPAVFGDFLGDACRLLTTLRLSSCKFLNDDCLLHIANNCRNLQELDLSSCTGVSPHGFFTLGRLIHLRWLSLYRTRITDEGVINIAEQCQHLAHWNFGSCMGIENMDRVLERLAQTNPGIRSLNLWRCVTISAAGVDHIARWCPSLEELDLGWCRNVLLTQNEESSCVLRLIQRCTRMRRLVLTGTSLLNSQDLITVGQTLREQLEQLDIHGSENINIAAVAILLTQCPRLRFLDVSFCRQILWHHVIHLRRLFPSCTIVTAIRDFEIDQLGNPIHRVLIEELMDEFMDRLQLAFGLAVPGALPASGNLLALPAPCLLPAITGPE